MTTSEYEKLPDFPAELRLDDQRGPASHLKRSKADLMIANALSAAGFDADSEGASAKAQETFAEAISDIESIEPQPTKKSWPLWQIAAATLLAFASVGSASAAVMWFAKQKFDPKVEQLSVPVAKPARKQKTVRIEAPSPEEQKLPEILAPEEVVADSPDKVLPRKLENKKPEDFLDEANRLRAQKRWQQADETYARVWQSAPNSDAAYVARIAAAGIRLDHLGDPEAALSRYRAALKVSSKGPLSEEARYGIAEAHRKLGDARNEAAALREFLSHHPSAGLAPKAKSRLSALGETP